MQVLASVYSLVSLTPPAPVIAAAAATATFLFLSLDHYARTHAECEEIRRRILQRRKIMTSTAIVYIYIYMATAVL